MSAAWHLQKMQRAGFSVPELDVSCLHLTCMAAGLGSDQDGCLALQGHIIGVDEFLELCKHWKRVTDKFPKGWKASNTKAPQTVRYQTRCTHTAACTLSFVLC